MNRDRDWNYCCPEGVVLGTRGNAVLHSGNRISWLVLSAIRSFWDELFLAGVALLLRNLSAIVLFCPC